MVKKTIAIVLAILFSIGMVFAGGYNHENECGPKYDKNGKHDWDQYKETKYKKWKKYLKKKYKQFKTDGWKFYKYSNDN